MGTALYRRYRPRSLDELVGQEHITDVLKSALIKKAISHAYLFTGPKGVGKTSVARILAHEINELAYNDQPHLDIIEIDAASNRRIDDIRDLRDKVHIAPSTASYKVYIIDEVHMLTNESFNALLKTLEEPPSHVIFILATTEFHKVPSTIVSRTQRFHFRPVHLEKVAAHLRDIATKENITIDEIALELVARYGDGSFRDSIGLLDQVSSGNTTIGQVDIESILGLAPQDKIVSIAAAIAARDYKEAVTTLEALYNDGNTAQVISEQLLSVLPTVAITAPHLYDLLDKLLELPRSSRPQLKLLALIASAAMPLKAKKTIAQIATPVHAIVSAPSLTQSAVEKVASLRAPSVKDTAISHPLSTRHSQSARNNTKDVLPAVDIPPSSADNPHQSSNSLPSQDAIVGFDWQRILDVLQERNPALFSVAKRAEARYNNGILTLCFTFSLHRKKLENAKYRGQLTSLISDLYGSCPELIIIDAASSLPADGVAASVAGLMGGGIVVKGAENGNF